MNKQSITLSLVVILGTANRRKVLPFSPHAAPAAEDGKQQMLALAGGLQKEPLPGHPAASSGEASPTVGRNTGEDGMGGSSGSDGEREGPNGKKSGAVGKKGGKKKGVVKAKSPKASSKAGKGKGKGHTGSKHAPQPAHKARKMREEDEEEEEEDTFTTALPHLLGMTKTTLWETGRASSESGDEDGVGQEGPEAEPPLPRQRRDVHDPIKTLRAIWADGQDEDDDDDDDDEEVEEEGGEDEEGGDVDGRKDDDRVAGSSDEGDGGGVDEEQGGEEGARSHRHSSDDEDDDGMMDEPLGLLTFRVTPKAGGATV